MTRYPLLLRAAAIVAVAAAIVVPLKVISGKVAERQARAAHVTQQFADETSGDQALAGPFLALTCEQAWNEERQVMNAGKAQTVVDRRTGECPMVFVAPSVLRVDATLPVDTLRRGIYAIRAFRAEVQVRGEFEWPAAPEGTAAYQRRWKEAFLVTRVGDRRGIKSIASRQSGDLLAGRELLAINGFSVRESFGAVEAPGTRSPFAYDYTLAGTRSFHVLPVGDDTEVRMKSPWPHPSFAAQHAPETRTVGPGGFEARWRVTSVSTGGIAAWAAQIGNGQLLQQPVAGAGVVFFDPVDIYALAFRATEYGFLFVLFTFAALALAEVTGGVRLHPVQYALVGCALAVFFLLLLALSEHLAFAHAYGIAAAACVALLTYYLRHPLGTWKRTGTFLALFASLYASLYVLLRLEDHALLLGSILVFAVLALAMAITREVDWSRLALIPAPRGAAPGSASPTPAS